MTRPTAPFEPAEPLFRRIELKGTNRNGVSPNGVRIPCSMNRKRFNKEPTAVCMGEFNGVAQTTPARVEHASATMARDPETAALAFELKDTPTDENPAHCEVDVLPASSSFGALPAEVRSKVKGFLARAYFVLIRPTKVQ